MLSDLHARKDEEWVQVFYIYEKKKKEKMRENEDYIYIEDTPTTSTNQTDDKQGVNR